jgi:hypothetical protein
MSSLKLLTNFFRAIAHDPRISITHIGIYAALLQYQQEHNFENPICAFSYEIMRLAKISGSATYHKVIKDLNDFGYITYTPSFKRNKASQIYIPEVIIKKKHYSLSK